LHLDELVGEDREDRSLVGDVVREVYVDLVGAYVGIIGRVCAREVLVLEEEWAVCRGQRGEGERALQVLAGRWVVDVDGVGLQNVVAIGCRGVDVFVDLAGVKRRVVVIADGEGNGVGR
jgi:hypothetical protein